MFHENFCNEPIFEEMICKQKSFDPKMFLKIFGSNIFSGNDFATIKMFDQKMFHENFWYEPIFEENTLQP